MDKVITGRYPDTVKDAVMMGYDVGGYATRYQRGYVSRRANMIDQRVYVAGGSRKGELYYLAPTYASTQYCVRVYIRPRV